ncbi:ribokinase [Neogemmobacter tilapiae]|uniref:Ribokinase n=1 Tax=Neogemmobacter tilapiae TaxID=875041 RepID=A0A918WNW7_9RHOB|nr:ribokinase [Gemmobacter tilapiae]GHC62502.1 ribokinase [Gemmobacter tilapiae]
MKPIVILGIFVADTAYRAQRMPQMGETILGQGFVLGPGGKGSNQAVAAGKAGGDVHMITRLGDDAFAGIARDIWGKAGVKPAVKVDHESYTGAAFIFVDSNSGNNAIIVANGAAGRIAVEDIEANRALIEGAGVFVTQLEQPIAPAHHGLAIARAAGVTTILNPAPAAELSDAMLALCDYLTPNESEAELLTGLPVTNLDEAKAAAEALLRRGVGAVILTLGANGVLYHDAQQTLHVPVVSAGKVIDTTGAGDAFNGGFAVALAEGKPIAEALRFGNATAGISVTRVGAAASSPERAEIDGLLQG